MGPGVHQGKEYRREIRKTSLRQSKRREIGSAVSTAEVWGQHPPAPPSARLVNAPVVSPSLRGGNSPSVFDKAERRLAARTDGHVKRTRNTNMGLGVHQGKNVAEMRAAVLTRRRCGFDTRPPHQKETCPSVMPHDSLCGLRKSRDGPERRAPYGAVSRRPVRSRPAPPVPGLAHPGKRLRHGARITSKGYKPGPTPDFSFSQGRAALWRTVDWYDTGALRGPILWSEKRPRRKRRGPNQRK